MPLDPGPVEATVNPLLFKNCWRDFTWMLVMPNLRSLVSLGETGNLVGVPAAVAVMGAVIGAGVWVEGSVWVTVGVKIPTGEDAGAGVEPPPPPPPVEGVGVGGGITGGVPTEPFVLVTPGAS